MKTNDVSLSGLHHQTVLLGFLLFGGLSDHLVKSRQTLFDLSVFSLLFLILLDGTEFSLLAGPFHNV